LGFTKAEIDRMASAFAHEELEAARAAAGKSGTE
jgi:hypothetical protein